jgi:multisubunit Na+/H+ antiporter MnhG subunit
MTSFARQSKDFWIGITFLFFGISAVVIGQDYNMGSAGRMGPAYFPIVLGSLLSLVGAIAVLRSVFRKGESIAPFYIRELSLVLVAVLIFGFLMRGAGLVPAAVIMIVMSAYAGPKFHLGKAVVLAAGLALFAVLLFVKLLGLPMSIFGPWLGVN